MALGTHEETSIIHTAGTDDAQSHLATVFYNWLTGLGYLGVCLSQRGSRIHQELADGSMALAGCLM